MLKITTTLVSGNVTLELLNALEPTKIQEYAERSTLWVNDPDINQYLGRTSTTLENSLDWYFALRSNIRTDRTFAIHVDDAHVGSCGIHSIDIENKFASLGILIGENSLHSRGIGTITMRLLCQHAFDDLELRKVWLHVFGHNKRGIRCYEKCGFKEVGRKHEHRFRSGTWQDEVTMEVYPETLIK